MRQVRKALLGPSYFYHRHLIEESKSWSPERIREYQQARFGPLIRRYGDEVTRKEDYREDLSRYSRWDLPLLARTVRTGGTSGQPLRFRADTFARRQKERAYLFDAWSQIGYAPFDLRVCYRGNIHGSLVRFDRLENAWLISPAATVEEEIGTLRRWVRTLPPFFLHVYPSSLVTFIGLVGEDLFRGLPIRVRVRPRHRARPERQAQVLRQRLAGRGGGGAAGPAQPASACRAGRDGARMALGRCGRGPGRRGHLHVLPGHGAWCRSSHDH